MLQHLIAVKEQHPSNDVTRNVVRKPIAREEESNEKRTNAKIERQHKEVNKRLEQGWEIYLNGVPDIRLHSAIPGTETRQGRL